eukprot:TRINITY_DN3355_c0_g1_i1.p2 TRINITY_DN3355_c0_g1~~TRINITY_DN3355_c0_g1_i1.p2  ORF type:complete len:191 (-),score=49.28 TRINITY_DN3355_c0_g1_i1:186-758(-)
MDSRFRSQHDITIGVEYGAKVFKHKGKDIRLQIWDTAGSETFKSITRTYYKGVAGALLVFDMTRPETFKNVKTWLQEVHENSNSGISLMLVGNKSDMVEERKVSYEDAMSFAQENDLLYIETSAKAGSNVPQAFETLAEAIYRKVDEGLIDVTQESSGVRVGSGMTGIQINKETAMSGYKKNDGCECCFY